MRILFLKSIAFIAMAVVLSWGIVAMAQSATV
jgi:hypothetical protein